MAISPEPNLNAEPNHIWTLRVMLGSLGVGKKNLRILCVVFWESALILMGVGAGRNQIMLIQS